MIHRPVPIVVLLALCIGWPAIVPAAETAETILIRQALEKDRSGRRRGNAELVMSAYDEDHFVVYDGRGSIDPRAWSVQHASPQAYGKALEADLAANRYDIARVVVFINVWKDKAFATTIDSGTVTDRGSGASRVFGQRSLWTFHKPDEEWLATGVIVALGDTADGPVAGRLEDDAVAAFLLADAKEWSSNSRSGIRGGLDEEVVATECHYSSTPAKWLIMFADRDEIDEWLEYRLDRVDYDLERTVVHAVTTGDEAVAVTHDRVTATYAAGDATIRQDRMTAWLLTRRGGRWQAAWILWKSKSFGDQPAGATALR